MMISFLEPQKTDGASPNIVHLKKPHIPRINNLNEKFQSKNSPRLSSMTAPQTFDITMRYNLIFIELNWRLMW